MNPCEISWFSALCDDDYEFLGVSDPKLKSSWEHCRDIVLTAETGGFDNILLPSGYALGIDTSAFAAATYSWVMAHPARPIPIVGTQNPERIKEIPQAFAPRWTRAEWYAVLVAARGEKLP